MNEELVKKIFRTCARAKRLTDFMPKLPDGMTPRHLRVMEAVVEINQENGVACIGDIGHYINTTLPSITHLINELEKLELVIRVPSTKDKRITQVVPTDSGVYFYEKYIREYHRHIAELFNDITPQDCEIMIETMNTIYLLMKKDKEERDNGGNL